MIGEENNNVTRDVQNTAYWVAALRDHCEFCDDPFAKQLAGREGEELWNWGENYHASMNHFSASGLGMRCLIFDGKINDFVTNGGRQIVILGAGMDSRCYRLNLTDCIVYEVDFQSMFDMKRSRIGNAESTCLKRIEVPLDLSEDASDWDELLIQQGFDKTQPTFFLLEGITMYLTKEANFKMFEKVSKLATRNSAVAGDFLGGQAINSVQIKPFDLAFRVCNEICNAPWVWGPKSEIEMGTIWSDLGFEDFDCFSYWDKRMNIVAHQTVSSKYSLKEFNAMVKPKKFNFTFMQIVKILCYQSSIWFSNLFTCTPKWTPGGIFETTKIS